MPGGTNRSRRRALAFLACAGVLPLTYAQDPRGAAVTRVTREWLALVDKLDASASWNATGERFRSVIPLSTWVERIKRDREPRGALVQRTVMDTAFGNTALGLPEGGSYAIVRFRTAFTNNTMSVEEVMLEVGPDYAWHVIGYVIQ